jgi:hypothetical protein
VAGTTAPIAAILIGALVEGACVTTSLTFLAMLTSPLGADTVTESDSPRREHIVTSTADAGEGSLRQALLDARASPGADTISFDPELFAEPKIIVLAHELPTLTTDLVLNGYIPDRLWQASGVTVDGGGRFGVFRVGPGARVEIRHLTIAAGRRGSGAGVINRGRLVLHGVTLRGNRARGDGGAVANLGGELVVINSTFAANSAARRGGGLANLEGAVTVTQCTFSDNRARRGGGLYNAGRLLLRNSVLANSVAGGDCASAGGLDPASSHNLIEANGGCGASLTTADPLLETLAFYNGPTPTYALAAGSPAINRADSAAAIDAPGAPLVWDQRGEGDPRFVGGFADLGAFEHQRLPVLEVDTKDDNALRGCTPSGAADCPLRGAIELANATPMPDVVRFDSRVFAEPQTLRLAEPLPEVAHDLTLDASDTGGVKLEVPGGLSAWRTAPGAELRLAGVAIRTRASPTVHAPAAW